MRTPTRLVASALLGGGLLFAGPVSAQEAPVSSTTPCAYPFVDCAPGTTPGTPTPPPPVPPVTETPTTAPIDGGTGGGATGGQGGGAVGGTVVDNSPVRSTSGGAASLPFTGGEVTLMALAGAAALGGGVVLVAAGRKRATS